MLIYLSMLETDHEKNRFTAIYNAYRSLMFYAARQILPQDADAEDAVHEAFLVVIRVLDRLDAPGDPRTKAFVIAVAENKAIDLWRKQRRMRDDIPYEPNMTTPMPEPLGLGEAMACLPVEYRSILLLRFDMGFTTKELAAMLGKKPETMTRTITRAKERLSRILQDMEKEGNA